MTHFPEFSRCSTCLPRSNLDPGKFRERLKLDRLGRIEIGEIVISRSFPRFKIAVSSPAAPINAWFDGNDTQSQNLSQPAPCTRDHHCQPPPLRPIPVLLTFCPTPGLSALYSTGAILLARRSSLHLALNDGSTHVY